MEKMSNRLGYLTTEEKEEIRHKMNVALGVCEHPNTRRSIVSESNHITCWFRQCVDCGAIIF